MNRMQNYLWAGVLSFASFPALSCTDFKLTAKSGEILITRSMEFDADLQSNLRSMPRGRKVDTTTVNNKQGLSWEGKYGYLYIDGFNIDAAFDGLNEEGLTFEYLYLPGETKYQDIPEGKDHQAIPYTLFGNWVLANFKTIDEVKVALANVYVVNQTLPQLGSTILPAHASIYDAKGRGIVVEFYNDKINVFDNIGVMTNSPKYDWHITNLRNFINLSAINATAVTKNGLTFNSLGQGSGAVGLPGDASPPSRFVKTAFMVKNVYPAENQNEALNLAQHIINNVDLPAGYVQSVSNGNTVTDTTQWVVFKDVTNKMLYYRTYNDLALRAVNMKEIDFSASARTLKRPLAEEASYKNITQDFLNAKN